MHHLHRTCSSTSTIHGNVDDTTNPNSSCRQMQPISYPLRQIDVKCNHCGVCHHSCQFSLSDCHKTVPKKSRLLRTSRRSRAHRWGSRGQNSSDRNCPLFPSPACYPLLYPSPVFYATVIIKVLVQPEICSNISTAPVELYHRVLEAKQCQLHSLCVLPLWMPEISQKAPVAVLEILQPESQPNFESLHELVRPSVLLCDVCGGHSCSLLIQLPGIRLHVLRLW